MTPSSERGPGWLALLASVLGVGIVVLQFGAIERVKTRVLASTTAGGGTHDLVGIAAGALGALELSGWFVVALLGAVAVGAVVAEARSGLLSLDLIRAARSHVASLVLLGALAFAGTRFYLAPGEFAFGDALVHASRIHETATSFAAGSRPDWSFHSYAGYALLQFYSPLFYWISAPISLVVGNAHDAAKVWLFLFHFGSAFALYAWARSVGLARLGAIIAGFAYSVSFQHIHTVIWAGALPVGPLYLFVPLLFFTIEKVLVEGGRPWIAALGAVSGAVLLSHHGHAAFAFQLSGVYALLRCALGGARGPHWTRLLSIALGFAIGLLLGAELLFSQFVEGRWVYPPDGLPFLRPDTSWEYLRQMVVWRNQWTTFTGSYFGVTLLVLALLGSFRAIRPAGSAALRATLGVSLVALICADQAGGRVGNWSLPALSILAGSTVTWFSGTGPRAGRIALALLFLLAADLGSTSIQSNFRADRRHLTRQLEQVAAATGPHRAMLAYRNARGETAFYEFIGLAGDVPIFLLGGFPQGAPRSLGAQLATVDQLNETPRTLEEADRDLLFLWNVGTLLAVTRSELVPPEVEGAVERTLAGGSGSGDDGRTPYSALSASPLLFSPAARTVADPDLVLWQERDMQLDALGKLTRPEYRDRVLDWIHRMEIDREGLAAGFFPLHPETPGDAGTAPGEDGEELRSGGTTDLPIDSALSILEYEVTQRRARIAYHAAKDGYLRLAFSWYPTLELRRDGEVVPYLRGLLGGIVTPTPAGRHVLEIEPTRTVARRAITWAGPGIGILLLIFLASTGKRRSREISSPSARL